MPACDQCGKTPAPLEVTSEIGLVVWNHYHPDDHRTALWFCSQSCIFQNGLALGERLKRDKPLWF
jgi:hypothetical protein